MVSFSVRKHKLAIPWINSPLLMTDDTYNGTVAPEFAGICGVGAAIAI